MPNSYHKLLNKRLNAGYKDKLIESLQQELKSSISSSGDDLFSMIKEMQVEKNIDGIDINILLKYYLLNQIISSSKSNVEKEQYIDTQNPNIKKDKNGDYYRIFDNLTEKIESLVSVNADGSYTIKENIGNCSLKVLKTYDINDKVILIKLVDDSGRAVADKQKVAEKTGLKREYKKRYKYSGYSGNSTDVIASLRNFLSTPIQTGYYMDMYCGFYKWHSELSSFVRVTERDSVSPYLVDFEYCDNGTVLRQEYTGIVA